VKSLDEYGELIKELDGFVKKLDESIRLEVFRFLLEREGRPSAAGGQPKAIVKDGRGLSPQELIRKCRVTNLTDKALVLAYWLENHEEKPEFSSLDLKEAFVKAREPSPGNPSDVVARLDGAGKLMKADKVGKVQNYRLTTTGIDEVTAWFTQAEEGGREK